jgi:hypothetical protein
MTAGTTGSSSWALAVIPESNLLAGCIVTTLRPCFVCLPSCCCCCCRPAVHREEQRSFEAWRDSLETVPTIKALRAKAEAIRAAEFEKALKGLGDGMSKKQMKAVEELSKGIVNKLLHGPMTALRCDGTDPDAVGQTLANMDALERMFQLSQQQQQQQAQARR